MKSLDVYQLLTKLHVCLSWLRKNFEIFSNESQPADLILCSLLS